MDVDKHWRYIMNITTSSEDACILKQFLTRVVNTVEVNTRVVYAKVSIMGVHRCAQHWV